jgi:O-antigen/teichoic acid export membrane protein
MYSQFKKLKKTMKKYIFKLFKNSDIQYFLNKSIYKFFQLLTTFFCSILLLWYLANYTSKNFFGSYQLIISTIGLLSFLSFPGIKDAILQSVSRGYDYSLIIGTKTAIKISFVGSFVLILLSFYYFSKSLHSIGYSIIITAFFFPFFHSLNNYHFFLEGKRDFKKAFLYNSFICLTNLFICFSILFFLKENLVLLITFILLNNFCINYYLFLKCSKTITNLNQDKDLLNYGWFMTRISVLSIIALRIDKIIIGIFLGPSSLAIYSIGILFPEKIKDIIKTILSTFMPQFACKKMTISWNKILIVFLCGILLFILFIFSQPIIMKVFFPKYISSIELGKLYSIGFIVIPLNSYISYFFRANKNKKAIYRQFMYSQIIYFICLGPLVFYYQINGLIYSKLLQFFSLFIISLHEYRALSSQK